MSPIAAPPRMFPGARLASGGEEIEMRTLARTRAALIVTALCSAAGARGAVLDFSGSLSATAAVAADPGCAPLPLRGTILPQNTAGQSSLGDFRYSHSICIAGGVGPVAGSFLVDFGADQFQGTVAGAASASGTPGVFDQIFNYTILGGTGRFAGAGGGFTGIGSVDPRNPPPRVNFAFDGLINAPAVPEPATWAMMLLGFGIAGSALRFRPAAVGSPQPAEESFAGSKDRA